MRGSWVMAIILVFSACGSRPFEFSGSGQPTERGSPAASLVPGTTPDTPDAGPSDAGPSDAGASAPGTSPCASSDLACLADALCPANTRDRCLELARNGGVDGREEPHCFLRTCCGGRGVAVLAQAHGACTRDDQCENAPIAVDCGAAGHIDWCGPPINRGERAAFDAASAAFGQRVCQALPQQCPNVSAPCPSTNLRCVAGQCQ